MAELSPFGRRTDPAITSDGTILLISEATDRMFAAYRSTPTAAFSAPVPIPGLERAGHVLGAPQPFTHADGRIEIFFWVV